MRAFLDRERRIYTAAAIEQEKSAAIPAQKAWLRNRLVELYPRDQEQHREIQTALGDLDREGDITHGQRLVDEIDGRDDSIYLLGVLTQTFETVEAGMLEEMRRAMDEIERGNDEPAERLLGELRQVQGRLEENTAGA